MKLNLKFYNGKDEYSDGDIEDKIIELIKKYPNDYEEAFKEDSSWPVFYHLSDTRKNSVRWYPFKANSSILEVGGGMGAITEELCNKCAKVTTIELSKRRATAILERNKNRDNLEIIVGNFKDIKLTEKYDYILLNGVLEYGALYMDSNNPYEDFINKLKKNLKEDGKILIAIENKLGLKYWCGANEDHVGIPFEGLNNYPNFNKIRTFSKNELMNLASKCKMNINIYYMFPDYKFPEVIYTDNFLEKNIFIKYTPYYSGKMNLAVSEGVAFKEAFDNKMIPAVANSYFVELSVHKANINIDFVKFNGYRNKKYNLYTYESNNKFYKVKASDFASEFYEEYNNSLSYLKKNGFNMIDIKKDSRGYYTDELKNKTFLDIILEEYNINGEPSLKTNILKYRKYLKMHYSKYTKKEENDIFDFYNIDIEDSKKKKLHFVEKAYIDITPQNMIFLNNDYYLIDQEWVLKNAPYEFILYRGIISIIQKVYNSQDRLDEYLKICEIDEYADEFSSIEQKFQLSIESIGYSVMRSYLYYGNLEKFISEKESQILQLTSEISRLNSDNKKINQELHNIYNSKRWRLMNKGLRILGK